MSSSVYWVIPSQIVEIHFPNVHHNTERLIDQRYKNNVGHVRSPNDYTHRFPDQHLPFPRLHYLKLPVFFAKSEQVPLSRLIQAPQPSQ